MAVLGRADAEACVSSESSIAIATQTGIEAYVFRGSSMGADRFGVVVVDLEPVEP